MAADLREPLTLASENGVLDILMVAKAAQIQTLPGTPTGWVYEICKRPLNGANACPQRGAEPNYYGGTRLQLERGDTLKVHLVNQLPLALDSDHASEPGHSFLTLNPTNLHTHGMLVSPNGPTATNPAYGDNVFVLTFNGANGTAEVSPHMHSTVRYDFTDYEIKIPLNHPSGLFWFHPHVHGLSLNQLSAGLSGIITVGHVEDYVCKERGCSGLMPKIGVHHIILKDAQILPGGVLQDQEDPDFCTSDTPGVAGKGACEGEDQTESDGPDYTGGTWYFTLNGQRYPTIPIKAGGGEIWRITNASGSATYDLSLWNAAQNRDMLVQVLSVDGVSVSPTAGVPQHQMAEMGGGKYAPVSCPGIEPADTDNPIEAPLCTERLHIMPSSRVEIWVAYRNAKGLLANAPSGATAVFRTNGYQTGPSGDTWPAADLARVDFVGSMDRATPKALSVRGEAMTMLTPAALSNDMQAANKAVGEDASCKALPPGHIRRIFYSNPTTDMDAFGLAYEEVDEHGNVVGMPATDVVPFNPMHPTICVPLGPHNTPAVERWQLVNVATEDHNFHIHQVKFRVVTKDEVAGTSVPNQIFGKGVMLDNMPLPHADGVCGNNPPGDLSNPISDWRAGLCKASAITVEIPFTIAGDFVYHCHILEHEDGGMMARIRVRPTH